MKHWSDLSEKERKQLLLYPAYISLLASTAEGGIVKKGKESCFKINAY